MCRAWRDSRQRRLELTLVPVYPVRRITTGPSALNASGMPALRSPCIMKSCACSCTCAAASLLALLLLSGAASRIRPRPPQTPPPFDQWLQALMAEARERGYSDDARRADARRPRAAAAGHPERPLAGRARRRLRSLLPRPRQRARSSSSGRDLAREHRTVLSRIESTYDVQRRFVVAIWGIETRYGRVTGNTPVFQALATLAWEPRRPTFFRGELFDALTMVSRGYIDAASMTGSWAGAMGHPQFMPSSYLKFARGLRRRRAPRHLAIDARRARVDRQLPEEWGWDDEFTWGREVRVTPAVRARIEQETTQPHRRLLRDAQHDRAHPARPSGSGSASGASTAARCRTSDVKAGLVTTDTRGLSRLRELRRHPALQLRALLRADGRAARRSDSIDHDR